MSKKKWLDMKIIRVKLNPEQAVLQCCEVSLDPLKYKYEIGLMGITFVCHRLSAGGCVQATRIDIAQPS